MTENEQAFQGQETPAQTFFSSIMQYSFDYWQTVMQEMLGSPGFGNSQSGSENGCQWPMTPSSLQEMFASMNSLMLETGLMENLTQGLNRVPDMSMRMAQAWTENMSSLLQESLNGMEQSLSQDPQSRPENSLQALVEAYSKSMQKMLNMPKLGLNRYSQERMAQAMDKLNQFNAVASEFSMQMLQPVESSFVKMQQKLKDMAEGDGYFEEAKEYYSLWIKILEGDYMNLLQSPEFIKSFHNVVNTYMEFYALYEEVMQDGLQFLPVTTKKDMNSVYKENYLLKKQVKALSHRMEDLEKKVEQLKSSKQKK